MRGRKRGKNGRLTDFRFHPVYGIPGNLHKCGKLVGL